MSWPDLLKLSGTILIGPVVDRVPVPVLPITMAVTGEANDRPVWGAEKEDWEFILDWTGEGAFSYWRLRIFSPDDVFGTLSSEQYGGDEELVGNYIQVSNALAVGAKISLVSGGLSAAAYQCLMADE